MDVDPTNHTSFRDSFHDVVDGITKVLYNSQSTTANEHWAKWAMFFRDVSLKPLLFLHRYMFPVFNVFTRKYSTWEIAPIKHQVCFRMVEDAVWYIGQEVVALGFKDPHLKIKV